MKIVGQIPGQIPTRNPPKSWPKSNQIPAKSLQNPGVNPGKIRAQVPAKSWTKSRLNLKTNPGRIQAKLGQNPNQITWQIPALKSTVKSRLTPGEIRGQIVKTGLTPAKFQENPGQIDFISINLLIYWLTISFRWIQVNSFVTCPKWSCTNTGTVASTWNMQA